MVGGTAAVSQLLGQAITIIQKIQDARAKVHGASDRLDGYQDQLDSLRSTLQLVQGEPELAAAEPLFTRLLPGLTDEDRGRLIRLLATRAADAYRRHGTAPPSWIAELAGA